LRAALLVGLNPLVLVFGVGGDTTTRSWRWWCWQASGCCLRRRAGAGAAAVTSAAGLKLSAALALPFLAVAERRRGASWRASSERGGADRRRIRGLWIEPPEHRDAVRLEQRYGYQLVSLQASRQALGSGPSIRTEDWR